MNIASMIERDLCFIDNLKQAPGKRIAGTKGMQFIGIRNIWTWSSLWHSKDVE